ncbi:MAG: putative response regulator, CheY [Pedosphaera sp.]|nr:putative response regulator, CheY [Pedosphaera sp.]
MSENTNEKYSVLIADDSEADSFFMERALRQSTRFHVIGSVRNDEEAIAYLSGQGAYADRQLWPFPNLLLMDLKTPRRAGSEVAEWLRAHPQPGLKVVNLSGSAIQSDIKRVKALGGDAFLTSSAPHEQLIELVARLERFLLAPGPHGGISSASPETQS